MDFESDLSIGKAQNKEEAEELEDRIRRQEEVT